MSYSDKITSAINYLDLYETYGSDDLKSYKAGDYSFYGYKLSDDNISEIKSALKVLFGSSEKFNLDVEDSSILIVKLDDGSYVLQDAGCGTSVEVLDPTQKATKTDDEIKIYKKVGYYSTVEDTSTSVLTTDIAGENVISQLDDESVDEHEYFEEIMESNIDKFDSYVFTFKMDDNGNYCFYSCEKSV